MEIGEEFGNERSDEIMAWLWLNPGTVLGTELGFWVVVFVGESMKPYVERLLLPPSVSLEFMRDYKFIIII